MGCKLLNSEKDSKVIIVNDVFIQAFAELELNEGGYTVDDGGPTMYGITEAVARRWGFQGDMHDLTLEQAQAIAKSEYWDVYQCDQFDARVAFQVFDAAYNGGHAVNWLQRATGVVIDGVLGEQTIGAIRSLDPLKLILRFDSYRISFLAMLTVWPSYGKGWMNRIAKNMLLAAA